SGAQGLSESAFEELVPEFAFAPTPPRGGYAGGPGQAYMIDTDINVDAAGALIERELTRNDATRIGDIAIYQPCAAPATYTFVAGRARAAPRGGGSHAPIAPPGRPISHYRWGSHDPYWSHNRWGSHQQFWSHWRFSSHTRERSHYRESSHRRELSH